MGEKFLLYDSRYYDEPDRAIVYTVSDTLSEAIEDLTDFPDGVIVKFELKGKELTNPKIVEI